MNNNKKFILAGIFGFAVFTILFGIYAIERISKISGISSEIVRSSEISQLALDFHVATHHTQLLIWEYAYEPNEKKLDEFNIQKQELKETLEDLEKLVETEANFHSQDTHALSGLTSGGVQKVEDIAVNFGKVESDWVELFETITELRELIELGYRDIDSAYHEEYENSFTKVRERMNISGVLFNALDFDRKIHGFLEDQEDVVWKLRVEQKSIISNFFAIFVILIVILIIFNTAVALMVSKFFKKN